jgi:DNA-binding transcriptional LysR family regulator
MDLLAAMRIFVRVVERGSMSAAARDLGIGQPAVSERIERLERDLGVRLLLRNTRVLACTDQGSVFYSRSKAVIEAADEARAAVVQNEQSVRGLLSIAAPQSFGEVVLPRILNRVREQYPQLRIDLILNDRIVDPVTEGVDISLRLGAPGEGNFVARRLGHVQRVLVAAPAYLQRQPSIDRPQDLARHPFIHVKGLFGDHQLHLVDAQRKTVRAPVTPMVSASHWRPVYELLLAEAGIGVLQEPSCAPALAEGRLVRVLPAYSVPGFDLHALYPAARRVPPKTRAVLAVLARCLDAGNPGSSAAHGDSSR